MTNVNGVNGANLLLTRAEVIALYKEAKITNYSEDDIQQAMLKGKISTGVGLDTFQANGNGATQPVELTEYEQATKAKVLSVILPTKVETNADYLALMLQIQNYPKVLADPDVQAALKAKKLELNPPAPQPTPEPKPEPKPVQTTFDCKASFDKLAKTDVSGETIQLQIDAEKTKQAILDFVPNIEIAKAKDFKANHAAEVQQFIDVAVDGKKSTAKAESLENIPQTKLTGDQKEQLRDALNGIKAMDLQTICNEFGIKIDTTKLANLGEDATPEQVAEQLGYVNALLEQIEGKDKDDETGLPTGLAKVRADRAAADKNIANNNKTIAKYEQIYADMVANGEIKEGDPDPNLEHVTSLQGANMEALKVVAKADAVTTSIDPLRQHLLSIQQQLNKADVDLKNIAEFDKEAEKIKKYQTKYEDDVLVKEQGDVDKATTKRDEASSNMTSAKFDNDKDLNAVEDSDKKANEKTDKKFIKYQKAQNVLSKETSERNVIKQVVDERVAKQEELDNLRTKDKEKPNP